MRSPRHVRPVRLLALTIGLLLLVQSAVLAGAFKREGGAVSAVAIMTSTSYSQTTYTSDFINVPGSRVEISVPSGRRALLLITFSAQSNCNGASSTYCQLRVAVDGEPTSSIVFDSVADGVAWEAHSYQWVVTAGPGDHSVVAQYRADVEGAYFTMISYTMTVLRSNL